MVLRESKGKRKQKMTKRRVKVKNNKIVLQIQRWAFKYKWQMIIKLMQVKKRRRK
jgi:uncharacterized protein YehS (DUF1456 family)